MLSATAIEASFISGEMDRSQSRRQVLILDCCHSGAFGGKSALGASIGIGSAFEGIGFGRVVLTATDATQYAWEGDRVIGEAEPSLFTNFLVLGIQSGAADLNGDGEITIDELYEYAYDEVVNSTSKQVPGKWAFKQQGEIVIARNPRGVRAAALPLALIEKIDSPLIGLQLEAIRDLVVILRGRASRPLDRSSDRARKTRERPARPDVAGAARSAVAMYPAAGRGAVARSETSPLTPTAGASQKIAHRQLSKLSALVLVVLALILFGALGIWNASRRGTIAGPSTSPPPRTEPSAVPTTGTPPTRSARRADTPTEAGSKVAEGTYNSAPQAQDKSESGAWRCTRRRRLALAAQLVKPRAVIRAPAQRLVPRRRIHRRLRHRRLTRPLRHRESPRLRPAQPAVLQSVRRTRP